MLTYLYKATHNLAEEFRKSSDLDEKRTLLKTIIRTLELDGENLGFALHTPFKEMQEFAKREKWGERCVTIRTINYEELRLAYITIKEIFDKKAA